MPERCVNGRLPTAGCRTCVSACPTGALSPGAGVPQVRSEHCVGCGLCIPVCPTDAIEPGGVMPGWPELADAASGIPGITLICRFAAVQEAPGDSDGGADVTEPRIALPCLGALAPDVLAALALLGTRDFTLVHAPCDGCPWEAGARGIRPTIQSAAQLASSLGSEIRFREVQVPARTRPEPPTFPSARRRVVGLLGRAAAGAFLARFAALASLGETTAPATQGERTAPAQGTGGNGEAHEPPRWQPRLPVRRHLLLQALDRSQSAPPFVPRAAVTSPLLPFARVQVDPDACDLCGTCAGLCPTGALNEAPGPSLMFVPAACTACGLCVSACHRQAVAIHRGGPIEALLDREPREQVRQTLVYCEECGHRYPDREPGCPRCRQAEEELLDLLVPPSSGTGTGNGGDSSGTT